MFSNIVRLLGGDPNKREIEKITKVVEQINAFEDSYEKLNDQNLSAKTAEFRQRLADGETLTDLLPEAFAVVREASKRTLGMRHYDVQMIGGFSLHSGKIAEMRTGEGKTLVATLPLYLNALTGRGVHLVTVNDYLARRDARWMGPIYHLLGLKVGVLQMSSRTDGGRSGFLVDLEKSSPHEDQHQLRMVHRRECYHADITYGTNSEFGFDYLRDNLTMRLEDRVQRPHYFAIVDEVDNILIDEARTPLIISGPAQDEAEWYVRMAQVVRALNPEDYEINEKDRSVSLTEAGEAHVEQIMDMALRDPDRPEDITPEQARLLGYLEQALRAQFLYRRNKDYLVQGGKVVIVDEFTGRLMPGRRWSEGLHQAVEAKEGVRVEPENVTYATITLQNYFRMYEKLAGMTGTAETEAEEFSKIYKLDVLPIPTNLEFVAAQNNSTLKAIETKDTQGYKYIYYTRSNDTAARPVYWKRQDYPDVVYRTHEAKLRAISQEIIHYNVLGRPQLIGTTSVEHSELLSERLQAEPVRRLLQVLLIRQAWMDQNKTDMITTPVPELQPLNKAVNTLTAGDVRQVARSYGVSLNLEDEENIEQLLRVLNLSEEDKPRLIKVLQGGVSHQVLNARKHDEESMIIARAGAFGAVTIATNMAGRGVDIKLGGEMSEELLRDVNRVLGKVHENPYDLNNEARRQALKKMDREEFGIYEESVDSFLQSMDEMERVRALGGLHVIGSERHEARRIDNQLRGRAARQGDPGSSRFYLSLEDELMRLFGGAQVENLWKRIFADESQPLEMNIIGRIVEQSQERVEGTNFDVRKHLLEYDDVLNAQRKRIYAQRDRVFTKEDLSEDVLDMLEIEMERRVPEALKDEEGPWKLLAYLEETQPPFSFDNVNYPSFTFRLLVDELRRPLSNGPTAEEVKNSLVELAGRALEAEREHMLNAARSLLERTEEALEQQRQDRVDMLDTYLEGMGDFDEDEPQPQALRPQETLQQITDLVRVPFKLNNEQMRRLHEGDDEIGGLLRRQIDDYLIGVNITRLIGAIERRLEESLNLKPSQLQGKDWVEVAGQVLDSVAWIYDSRIERLAGDQGQIARDLQPAMSRVEGSEMSDGDWMELLMLMAQGTKVAFDARTHRRGVRSYNRLDYVYLASRLLQDAEPQEMTERVLEHLEAALVRLQEARGIHEWNFLYQNEASLNQIGDRRKARLIEAFGVERFEEIAAVPVTEMEENDRKLVIQTLGKFSQNEAYRDLLLRVISEQWVDYLTRVEALRVSIGLEAYAQRDPLVQYKGRATEMFTVLLGDIRAGVIAHVFTYQTRRAAPAQIERETSAPAAQPAEQAGQKEGDGGGKSRKKKRKRH
jgi:preprotein translocase subunit SecA